MPMSGAGKHYPHNTGYVLITFTLSLLAVVGAVGLTVDIGRMYITRGEARSFCDAAALAAAMKLDGTTAGLTNAKNAALATVKGWNFGTKQIDSSNATIQVDFGQVTGGHCDFSVAPNMSAQFAPGYICAKVTASNLKLPMFFMPVLTNVFSSNIAASGTAAQVVQPGPGAGAYAPFSPFAHPILQATPTNPVPDNPGDPFNFTPGLRYTLVWPNEQQLSGKGNKDLCEGDADAGRWAVKVTSSPTSNRGYIYNSANNLNDTIVANEIPPGAPVINTGAIIQNLYLSANGDVNSAATALMNRVLQDSDQTSTSIDTYHGNGARRIIVPINVGYCGAVSYLANGNGQNTISYTGTNTCQFWTDATKTNKTPAYSPYQVVGWGEFLLLDANYYKTLNGNDSVCAVYVGAGPVMGTSTTTGTPNVFKVVLVE
jgi:hypothetical protein